MLSSQIPDELKLVAHPVGVAGVLFNTPTIPGEHEWAYETLVWLRQRCEQYGLCLEALENTPLHFYDRVMLVVNALRSEQVLPSNMSICPHM